MLTSYKQVGVQMHELGHNFNLALSGGLSGATYTDHTGLMGNPLHCNDVGKMQPLVNLITTVQLLVGIADYNTTANTHPGVVRIETDSDNDQFIGFNRALGINALTVEADDEVTIVQTGNKGENYSQSVLKAHIIKGESFTFTNWDNQGRDLIISAIDVDLAATPAVAPVSIILEEPPSLLVLLHRAETPCSIILTELTSRIPSLPHPIEDVSHTYSCKIKFWIIIEMIVLIIISSISLIPHHHLLSEFLVWASNLARRSNVEFRSVKFDHRSYKSLLLGICFTKVLLTLDFGKLCSMFGSKFILFPFL